MKKIMIVMMLIMVQCVDAKVMKRAGGVATVPSQPAITQPAPIVTPSAPAPSPIQAPILAPMMKIDQDAIKKRLDEQLRSPVENAWNDRINDVFDLAMVNRELARDYFIKMREKMVEAGVKPVELIERPSFAKASEGKPIEEKIEEPMKRATGPRKPAVPKMEPTEASKTETTEGVAAGEEPMKKGAMPAPKKGVPSGGPKKNLTPTKGVAKPGTTKEEAPKVTEQIFSVSKLKELDNDKLIELFNDLLEKLGTVLSNWNGMAVERVEEKTKHSSRIYNVYGVPVPDWTRKIDTLKKVLISKNIMSEIEVTKKINDRIAQVRAEKTAKPVVSGQPEEKRIEEITEADVVRDIKELLAKPADSRDTRWETAMQANIRRLKPLNRVEAEKYRDELNNKITEAKK